MSRVGLLQPILDLFDKPKYLEIGVFRGETFKEVVASEKVAVDVKFQFEPGDFDGERNCFYEMTSDEFFYLNAAAEVKFDLIFIDGLHEYTQTLRDLLNSVTRLTRRGVIVVDDVVPSSYAASLPDPGLVHEVKAALGSAEAAWMGDAFKIPFFVRSYLPQFSYATVEGGREMIMWGKPRRLFPHLSTEWIERRDFSDTIRHSDVYCFRDVDSIMSCLKDWTANGT